jgi:hypothetical protein
MSFAAALCAGNRPAKGCFDGENLATLGRSEARPLYVTGQANPGNQNKRITFVII